MSVCRYYQLISAYCRYINIGVCVFQYLILNCVLTLEKMIGIVILNSVIAQFFFPAGGSLLFNS